MAHLIFSVLHNIEAKSGLIESQPEDKFNYLCSLFSFSNLINEYKTAM